MRCKEMALNLLLAFSSIFLLLGSIEGGLRLFHFEYSPLKIVNQLHSDWRAHHMFEDRHFVYDPYLLWKPNPAFKEIFNSKGFRGEDFTERKAARTQRIFAIGDSNTLGLLEGGGDNWPQLLEELLQTNQDSGCFEVINAGVYGYTSFQGLRRFQQILKYDPDLVLVSFGANDAHKVFIPDKHYQTPNQNMTRLAEVLLKTRTYQLVLAAAGWLRGKGTTQVLSPRVSLQDYRHNLQQIITIAREHNITVILLTRPFIGVSDDPLWWKTDAPQYNAMTLQVAQELQVPVMDVHALFADKTRLFGDEAHFTLRGHAEMAKAVYNFLIQQGLIQAEPFTARSSIQMDDALVYQLCQLGEGWHEVENWPPAIRWTKERAVAYLHRSPSQHTLVIRVCAHQVTSGQVVMSGKVVKRFNLEPGWHELTSSLPPAEDSTVKVEIAVDNPRIPPRDGRLLGIAVEKIGLE